MDSNDLVNIIKNISKNERESNKPMNLCFGKVISTQPLQIQIEQKIILEKTELIIPKSLTDYEIQMNYDVFDFYTENTSGGSGESAFSSHNHKIVGNKKIKILNALKKDDELILLRIQGGQKFLVLDRIGGV